MLLFVSETIERKIMNLDTRNLDLMMLEKRQRSSHMKRDARLYCDIHAVLWVAQFSNLNQGVLKLSCCTIPNGHHPGGNRS
jgi:hypothetical protein